MRFDPTVNQSLVIEGIEYHLAEHPVAKGMPYGQQGRKGTVYLLESSGNRLALKVFSPRFREPAMVGIAECLGPYTSIPGLAAADRRVLTARRHAALLREYEDLTYAVLMPWVEGPTWTEVIGHRLALSDDQSLTFARSLTHTLLSMEERGLAHCDLSGANVLLPALAGKPGATTALVDLEEMHGPGFMQPTALPSGSPGYAHARAASGLWSPEADRFAGAVLLAEMLGWCDDRVRRASWGDSYFDPGELQQESERFLLLMHVLHERQGTRVADLFIRAWHAEVLRECATFGEWMVALMGEAPAVEVPTVPTEASVPPPPAQIQPPAADDLADLYAAGVEAYHQGQLPVAKELLAEVVRRQPDYAQGGQKAAALLQLAQEGASTIPLSAPPLMGNECPNDGLVAGPLGRPDVGELFGRAAGWLTKSRSGQPEPPPTSPVVVIPPTQLASLLRLQEQRFSPLSSARHIGEGRRLTGQLWTALKLLRERIEYSLPHAGTILTNLSYADFADRVQGLCDGAAVVKPDQPNRLQALLEQAEGLRHEVDFIARSLRRG